MATCKQCNTEFEPKEVNRVYGKDSQVALTNVCSAACYTNRVDKLSKPRYLLLSSDELNLPNIAVIKCDGEGEFNTDRLQIALAEDLDREVQINSIESLSQHPLKYVAKCSYVDVDGNDELIIFSAQLNETWVY